MNRDEIIRMAREAGMFWFDYGSNDGNANMLEKFAALVAAEKEQQIIHILERLQERVGNAHNYYKYAINVIQQEQPR